MKIINKILSRIKKIPYSIDSGIPISYLLSLFISRIIMLIRGSIVFCKKNNSGFKILFVDKNVTIKCASKLTLGKYCSIGRNSYIDALSKDGIFFGNNVSVGKNTTIECTGSLTFLGKGLRVGNNVGLGTHGFFGAAGGIEIGDDTILGNFVSIHSENHNFKDLSTPIRLQGVNQIGIKIGKECWIGAKATILDGTIIGNHCVVSAGAVVRGKYPNNCVIGGVPSRILKMIE